MDGFISRLKMQSSRAGSLWLLAALPTANGLHAVRVLTETWQRPLYDTSIKSTMLKATIADGEAVVGSCGIEIVPLDSHGVEVSGRASGAKPRAVLSGTLFVEPSFRRQGIARRLLLEAEGWARGQGAREMILIVKKSNAAALRLYEKMGYCMQPHVTAHGALDCCMRKKLFTPTSLMQALMPQRTMVADHA